MEAEPSKALYLPAHVALWLLLESGVSDDDPDVEYLRSLGSDLVLIQEDE